jgi:hypothetical protein
MLTQHWALTWWVGTAVLVVLGAGLQWWLTVVGDTAQLPAQRIHRSIVGGTVWQDIRGSGVQTVNKSHITGGLTQAQETDSNGDR